MQESEKDKYFIEPGQSWEADLFRPSDAEGVVRLFISVYGKDYPIRAYVDPELLIKENESGNIISAVARTIKGEVIGHDALFRSAPYGAIREAGAGVVHTSYRGGGGIFTRLTDLLQTTGAKTYEVEAIYGEPVCNHVYSQKMCHSLGWTSFAMEVDLMPASVYAKEKSSSGRVSSLLDFKIIKHKPHGVFIPACYEETFRFLYSALDDSRKLIVSREMPDAENKTLIETCYFDFAQSARLAVWDTGPDFTGLLEKEEESLGKRGAQVIQVWLNLSKPWTWVAVEELRSRGYFMGGVLPRWFDHDGMLMQKLMQSPNWETCQVHFERGRRIFELVKSDWLAVSDNS